MSAALLAVLLFAATAPVVEDIKFEWNGPQSCPFADFRAALAKQLAQSRAKDSERLIKAKLVVDEKQSRWTLELELQTRQEASRRTLSGKSCQEVVDTTAFVVALAIDPTLGQAGPSGATVPEPERPEPTGNDDLAATSGAVEAREQPGPVDSPLEEGALETESAPEPQPRAEPSTRRNAAALQGGFRLASGIAALELPGISAVLQAGPSLIGRFWRVNLTGGYRFATKARAELDSSVGGRFDLWFLSVTACGVPEAGPIEFPLCGGIEAGQVQGRGTGDAIVSRQSRLPWLGLPFSAGLLWRATKVFALTFDLQVAVAILRHRFVIQGLETVHEIGPVSLRATAGLEFRFPPEKARLRAK